MNHIILAGATHNPIETDGGSCLESRLMPLRCVRVWALILVSATVPAAFGQIPPPQATGSAAVPASVPTKADAPAPARINTEADRQAGLPLPGKLFTTREQRDKLDRARRRGGMVEEETIAPSEARRSVINGFVKRSDGRDTVWVDDAMRRDPRAEMVQQLEPNMVGGVSGGSIRIATSKPLITVRESSTVNSGRTSAKNRKSHKRKARLLKMPKLK